MFVNCKKNLAVRVGDEVVKIEKDFIGEIPDKLAGHWMIQAAIKDGTIATPTGTSDKKLEQADTAAAKKAEAADIRPDANQGSDAAGAEKAEAADIRPDANQGSDAAGAEKAEASEGEKKPKK